MALPAKTKKGSTSTVPAQRQFTDREEFQVSFQNALANANDEDIQFNILTFYGVGGVGKSSLQKHLKEEHLDKDENSVYSWLDFEEHSHKQEHKAFRILANNFKSKFKIPFTAFDLAYMVYWSKAFPEYEIKKEGLPFLEEGSQLSSIVGMFSEAGGIGGTVLGVLGYVYDKSKELSFDKELRDELEALNNLEADAIEDRLGYFFASDIDRYMEENPSKKVVIFLDTYEALWRENRSDGNAYSQDEWIRNNLIGELPNALYVICGREKVKWGEYEEDWKPFLNQHILDNLSELDSKAFLSSCSIKDEAIQESIYKASKGYPYYLDLCVDTYSEIQKSGKNPSVDDFQDLSQDKIFKRFMEYLSEAETNILYTLSHAQFFTKEIFQLLLGTKYTNSDMKRVVNFSFISEDNSIYYMHNIMRESLLASPSNAEDHVNKALFEFYDASLQDLDIKNISQKSLESLQEAFYHKKQMGSLKALSTWYIEPFSKLYSAAKYKVLIETSLRLKELSEEHPSTATFYNNLAELYRSMGKYEKALPLYEKALSVREKVLGVEHRDTADFYNNLALLYKSIGEYEKALPLHKKSLTIREKVLGEEHPRTADSYNNLAVLYYFMGEYEKALPLYEKALTAKEKVLEDEHPRTADSYDNLAVLYYSRGEYEKALPLYKKALTTREKLLGDMHPSTADSYNNLAELYKSVGEYEKALPLYEKALIINEKVLGENHPNTTGSYNNLAIFYYEQGDIDKALEIALNLGEDNSLYKELLDLQKT